MRLHTRSLAVVATMVVGCGGASDDARLDARGGDAGEPDAQPDAPTDAHVDAPTDAPPGVSIASIQDGTLPTGTAVRVNGAAVTGVDATGFMAQDPDVPGGLYAGGYVDTGGAPAVAVGDRVDFTGTTAEVSMNTEVAGAVVVRRAAGALLAPIPLTVAQAATEPYEGVLVTLIDVNRVDYPHSCAIDNPACTDSRLFQVNFVVVGWDRFYQDGLASWNAEVTAAAADMTPTVTGVTYYRFDRRRIAPRSAADITP